jgi:VWFA-related protein
MRPNRILRASTLIPFLTLGLAALAAGARQAPPAATAPAVSAPAPAAGGEAAGGAVPGFAEGIEVAVVDVDVVVRDGAGKPVSGLRREDFKLFVDGAPTEIGNFLAGSVPAGGGGVTGGSAAPPPAGAGAAAAAGGAAEAGGAAKRLALVVYIDNAYLRPVDRNRLLKQVREFLKTSLGPEDQVAVVTHDLGLQVRHSFRAGQATLWADLDKLEKEPAQGISKGLALRQTLEQIRDNGCKRVDESLAIARSWAEESGAEAKVTYASLNHMMESLGGLSGRKVLLYVGDGVAVQPGTDVFGMIQELCGAQVGWANTNLNTMNVLHQVTAAANANQVTVYTLEGSGLGSYATADVDRPLVSFELDQQIRLDRQGSLNGLARDTGGRPALNGNNFSHDLQQMEADVATAYSLGFSPAHPGDGKMHTLRVEVDRPGMHLTYRPAYRDRSPAERLAGMLEAALIHGIGDNPLGASIQLGTATPSEHGRVLLPVKVQVPFAKLAFLPQDDARHGRVIILMGNMDARGGMAPMQHADLPLRVPEADAKRILASQMGYDVKLIVEPGRQRLAFVVRDDVARVASLVIQEVDVDKKGTVTAVAATGGGRL